MANVSRPLLGVLVATVAFFALWIVALKPSSSSTSGGAPAHGLGAYQSAINRAKGVQAIVNHGAAAVGGTPGTTAPGRAHPSKAATSAPAVTPKTHVTPKTRTAPAHASTTTASPAERENVVAQALAAHKVLAILFYNPYASDDVAVEHELRSVPTHSGKVVKLTVPLSELSDYTAITREVPVDFSPTLVIINRAGQATTIAGFADTFEIEQRIDDAL